MSMKNIEKACERYKSGLFSETELANIVVKETSEPTKYIYSVGHNHDYGKYSEPFCHGIFNPDEPLVYGQVWMPDDHTITISSRSGDKINIQGLETVHNLLDVLKHVVKEMEKLNRRR